MLLLVIAVSVVLVISFLCSIFESVLLSLTRSQIAMVGQRRKRAGRLLSGFKENMDVPIAAILILNTAAHTVGAAVAGASVRIDRGAGPSNWGRESGQFMAVSDARGAFAFDELVDVAEGSAVGGAVTGDHDVAELPGFGGPGPVAGARGARRRGLGPRLGGAAPAARPHAARAARQGLRR